MTSTGHVRKEFKDLIARDVPYKRRVNQAINTNPHVYNLLQEAFQGGYTHANFCFADTVLDNVDSYDETSAYPYVMVTHKYPAKEFVETNIKSHTEMSTSMAYLLVIRFTNLRCKYLNTFISKSKCRYIKGATYDNGRIINAAEIEIVLTDVDFRLILETYKCEYEILESWTSIYHYLPITFINFILDKYVKKTEYKNVAGKELEYAKEKNRFNSLYGFTVTNEIRDEVEYDNELGWSEIPLSNDEIVEKLEGQKKKSFLSFAYGVWVTAYARNNLIKNIIKNDEYAVYADTDSIKLVQGYDKKVFEDYNNFVARKIEYVSRILGIDINKYMPKDKDGIPHMLGVFECETKKDISTHMINL